MDVVLLWSCFLAVLAGIVVALGVIVRDVRRQLVARREARDLETTTVDEIAPALIAAPVGARGSAGAAAALAGAAPARPADVRVPAARRGLGAPAQGYVTPRRPAPGRGLGSTTSDAPRASRSSHRGLGRRPHS